MAGFTKGPWRYDGYRVRSHGNTVADLRYKNGANDGRLIAAAPDLYEALEAILNAGSFHHSAIEIDTHAHNYKDGEQLEAQARAAMSKARGE